jgi:ABC-type lipoprotein export system ATPase subunit/ABC-type antimicrobial peptide transport system permease subunit
MLTLKNVNKTYYGPVNFHALKNVNVSIKAGEFVAILGESGSGKSTLLNVISGLDKIDTGEIIIEGVSTKNFSAKDYAIYRNYYIGFVFQEFNLITHLNLAENVELPLLLQGMKKSEARKKAVEQLEIVGLKKHIYKRPGEISGGQQQRVSIARSLVTNPLVIMADEPTGALDTQTSEIIMRILKTLAKDKIVIMVTHEEEIAETYATRIIRLSDGEVVSDSNPVTEDTKKDEKHLDHKRPKMNLNMAAKFAANNLRTRAMRTLFTSLTMSIGMITFFLLSFMLFGLENNIIKSISSIVPPNEYQILSSNTITNEIRDELLLIDGIDETLNRTVINDAGAKRLVSEEKSTVITTIPTKKKNFSMNAYMVGEYPAAEKEILISSQLANSFYATTGTIPTIELYNRIKANPNIDITLRTILGYNPTTGEFDYIASDAVTYKIVGIVEANANVVFVYEDDLVNHIAIDDDYQAAPSNNIYIYLVNDTDEVKTYVQTKLEEDHNLFVFNMFEQTVNEIKQFLGVAQTVLTVVSSLSLIVSGILIGLIMYISVIERTKEIGILNALGARKGNIQSLFIFESGLIGFVSTILAFAISFLIGQFINRTFSSGISGIISEMVGLGSRNMQIIQINIGVVAAIFVIATLYSILCGLIPAVQASNLKAIDALRNE